MSKAEKLVVGALVSCAVGILLKVAGAFSPIHEIGHLLCAWLEGSPASITAWNVTSVGRMSNSILIAGHYFELFVYFVVVMMWKKKKRRSAAFAFGCLLANMGQAARSVDINVSLLSRTNAYYVSDVLTLWVLINLAFLTWAGIALTIEIHKEAVLLNASERSNKREDAFNTPSEETFFAIRRETDLRTHSRSGKKG